MKNLNTKLSFNFNLIAKSYPLIKGLNFKKIIIYFLLLKATFFSAACSSLGVQPWEREVLSKKEMIFGAYVLEAGFEDHTYFSKEGSSGGRSFSAGGCGCN
jgi:hypothetical protein